MSSKSLPPDAVHGAITLVPFPRHVFYWLGVILAAACLACIGAYISNFGLAWSEKQEHWGQFSDFVGGLLNPLIGVVGFVGVVLTLRQQQRTLDLQYHQIQAEREALIDERNALQRSEAARHAAEEERRTAEKVRRFMPLLSKWEEPDLVEARATLANHLRGASLTSPMLVRDYRRATEPIGRAFHAIFRYLARLNLLIEHGLIRQEDVENLLGDEVDQWTSYLPYLSFDRLQDWSINSPEAVELQRLHLWFMNNLDPLAERLGLPYRVPS